jgi:hypothetical protein
MNPVRSITCSFAVLLVGVARADISIPFPHDSTSGVTIKLSSPVASVPHFGFMPIHVSIENLTTHDGTWRFQFETGSSATFPGLASSTFELSVPAPQTREAWFFVPIAEPGMTMNPAALAPAVATSGGAVLPTAPPAIAGVYPDPRLPGVTFHMRGVISTSAAGLVRTFTIEQEGPAGALPMLAADKLPPQAKTTVSPADARGIVTRTTVIPMTVPRGGGTLSFSPGMSSGPPVAMRNSMAALTAAGFTPTGIRTSSSGRGINNEMTVTIRQIGPASLLPLPPLDKLPKGFTSVNVSTDPSGETVREFVYVETNSPTPTLGGAGSSFFVSGPMPLGNTGLLSSTPATAEAEARRLLAPTGLLQPPAGVTTRTVTNMVTSPPSAGAMRSYPMIIFEQTGPRAALPVTAAVPDGVRVSVHPGPGSDVVRVISVIDPGIIPALQVMATSSASSASMVAQSLARVELQRAGFLRMQPGITQSASARTGLRTSGVDTFIFSESGPPPLLPAVAQADLPPGITCTVTPGPLTGETSRNFIVPVATFLASLGSAPRLGGALSPGTLATSGSAFGRAPMAVSGGMTQPSSLNLEVIGPGVAPGTRAAFPNAVGATALMPMATTPALDGVLRGRLAVSGMRSLPNVSAFEPAQVPADWRVWSSFSAVVLKTEDFAGLDRAHRGALHTWITSGGTLFLVPPVASPGSPSINERIGAGRIHTLGEPLDVIAPSDVVAELQLMTPPLAVPDRDQLRLVPGTPMGDTVKFEPADMLWLSLFLIVFAALIGPVNLLWFAPAAKRHRLFITTPLLSAAGALAVAAAIVIQDGVGGNGVRRALVLLVPGESQAVVFQEQAARSGFLTARDFALDDGIICAALPTDVLTSYGPVNFRERRARAGGQAGGDWFRNRSRQAQLLRAVVPTRARIEIVDTAGDGAPVVESTFPTELREFRLRDEHGAIWTADALPTGRRMTLHEVAAGATSRALDGTAVFAAIVREATELVAPGQWCATGGATELAPIATLAAIRWGADRIIYAGVAGHETGVAVSGMSNGKPTAP